MSRLALRRLRAAMVLLGLMAVAAAPGIAHAQAAPAVTFDKVLELLELEVKEAKILSLIEQSPTTFVLGDAQVQKLKQAGASDAVIAAMQKKGKTVAPGSDISEFVVILDCSGSMKDRVPGGSTKWEAARQAAVDLVSSIPAGRKLSFIAYGHDATRGCDAVEVLRPLGVLENEHKATIAATITRLQPVGTTPIAGSLRQAGVELAAATALAEVILITDGMESCKGDPVAEAAALVKKHPNLAGGVSVVAFGLNPQETAEVERIAKAGSGSFYDAKTAPELVAAMKKIEQRIVQPAVVEEPVDLEGLSAFDRALIEQLGDPEMKTRMEAAKLLGERNVTAAVPALMKVVARSDYDLREAANDHEFALVSILKLAPGKAGAALGSAFQAKDRRIREWAGDAMARHKVADAAPHAVEFLLHGEPDWLFGSGECDLAAKGLSAVDRERLEVTLLKLMKEGDERKKPWAAKTLGELSK
jgi:Mg-chelatase subunit ChlD